MRLASIAAEILRDNDAPPAHVAVAAVALAEAVRARLDVPAEAGLLLWHRVERSPRASWSSIAAEAVGHTADRPLCAHIAEALLRRDAGRDVREAALSALAVPHAARLLLNEELVGAAEVLTGYDTYLLVHVVVAASEARTIEPTIVKMIVDHWWSREDDVRPRIAALDLADLLDRDDRHGLFAAALRDPSARVRGYAALRLDAVSPEVALALIADALAQEADEGVRADLARARVEAQDAARRTRRLS